MDAAAIVDIFKSFGGTVAALGVIAAVIWRSWIMVKTQMKEDSKGAKLDERLDSYTDNLQKTVDKLVTKIETLQTQNNDLVMKSAQMSAELVVAHAEAEDLKAKVEDHIARIRYLEDTLNKAGVTYV